MLLRKYYTLIFLCISATISAQNNLGTWNVINLRTDLNNKWSLFGEAQIRSLKLYDHFHYYEYKGGFAFRILPQLQVSLAAGNYDTYREGGNFRTPMVNNETRIWQQIALTQQLGGINIEHRYRTEQRFTSNGYRNRFRYRLGATFPIQKEGDKTIWYMNINNELFFTDRSPHFERNRFFTGFGRLMNKGLTIQAGYLYQSDYKVFDETGKGFFQITAFINIKNRGKYPEKIIRSTID